MKKIYSLIIAWCCTILWLCEATAQERLLISVTYDDGLKSGLYYLNKDGSGGVQAATNFVPEEEFGGWPEYFIVSKDGEIVGINSSGGPYNDENGEGGYGTLYRMTGRGIVRVQTFSYAEASQTFLAEGWNEGKLYGTGPQPISDQILIGTKYAGLQGYTINKYGFLPGEILAANNGSIYGVARIGGTYSQGYIYKFSGTGIVTVYSFSKPTGHYPLGQLLQGQDGYLYGVAKRGGSKDYGVIYKVKFDGTSYQVLHQFDKTNGMYPDRGLVQDPAGNLYGFTHYGGGSNLGVIYKIRPDGTGFTKLHDFTVKQEFDGAANQSMLLDRDGFLYGRVPQSQGMVFRIKTDGTGFKIIFSKVVSVHTLRLVTSITPQYKIASPVNGATGVSTSPVVMLDSVPGASFYRMEVSKTPDFSFVIADGTSGQRRFPLIGLEPGSTYYLRMRTSLWSKPGPTISFTTSGTSAATSIVTTPSNGATNVQAPTLKVTVKAVTGAKRYTVQLNTTAEFTGTMFTQSSTVDDQRTLTFTGLKYNTKYYARVKTDINSAFGPVTNFTTRAEVFSYVTSPSAGAMDVDPTFVNITVVPVTGSKTYTMQISNAYTFSPLGTKTYTSLTDNQVTFMLKNLRPSTQYYTRVKTDISTAYGVTKTFTTRAAKTAMRIVGSNSYGGQYGHGTIFSFSIDSAHFKKHYDVPDMSLSYADLIQAPDGFYGTRHNDASSGNVFRYNFATGFQSSPLINVTRETDIMLGSNGMLYVTPDNAPYNNGAIYRMTPDLNTNSRVHFFTSQTGTRPHGPLLEHDGYLYGTTHTGGTYNRGVVYRMKGNGSEYQVVYNFNTPGFFPAGGVTMGVDGYLYGTTNSGPDNDGTVYRMKPDGSWAEYIHTFSGNDGRYPTGELLVENFFVYGTTSSGGIYDKGVLYRMKTDGTEFLILHHFNGPISANPTNGVVSNGKGTLYGFLTFGGSEGLGSVYRIGTDGAAFQQLFEMDGNSAATGLYPYGRPILIEDPFTAPSDNTLARQSEVHVYPNPSTGNFTLQANVDRELVVELSDFTGNIIYKNKLQREELKVGENLPKGIYILRVHDGTNVIERKLIKK